MKDRVLHFSNKDNTPFWETSGYFNSIEVKVRWFNLWVFLDGIIYGIRFWLYLHWHHLVDLRHSGNVQQVHVERVTKSGKGWRKLFFTYWFCALGDDGSGVELEELEWCRLFVCVIQPVFTFELFGYFFSLNLHST